MVPICDATGENLLGFGGRVVNSGIQRDSEFQGPKYLNTPETLVFKKKLLLFGQHMAEKALLHNRNTSENKKSVVIVEGYMDAISLWQAGVQEVVACMGTSLTTEQLKAASKLVGGKNGKEQ